MTENTYSLSKNPSISISARQQERSSRADLPDPKDVYRQGIPRTLEGYLRLGEEKEEEESRGFLFLEIEI